jgi:hypothetical protein
VVVTAGGVSSNVDKTYTYRPVLGAVGTSRVWLHDLASRSQRKEIVRTQSAPYFVSGTDSRTGEAYLYQTDVLYNTVSGTHVGAYSRESDERGSSFSATPVTSGTPFAGGPSVGTAPNQLTALKSGGSCTNTNAFGGATTYCSIFGPEVYTESFYAQAGQSLSFEWRAKIVADDYEIYAFLVRVADDDPVSYGPSNALIAETGSTTGKNASGYQAYVDSHTLVAHSLGRSPGEFFTASAAVPDDGLYRFRFVNGSYDATGGFVWGSEMYIKNTILVGTTNAITVNNGNPLGDQVGSGSPVTYSPYVFNVSATSGAAVAVSATGKCSASTAGTTPTVVTVTNSGGAGDCTLRFSQGASGEFAPAEDVTRKFTWLAAATAPPAPTIASVTASSQSLTVGFLAPSGDGGSAILNYEYSTNNGANWTAVDPPSATSPILIQGLTNGTTYTLRIRAVNSVGPGTQSVASTGTPSATAPGAPSIALISAADSSVSVAFVPPTNDGGSAITNYQYSTDNGVTWVSRIPSSTASPILIDSLTNGTTYQIRIRAVNNTGAGAASAAVAAIPAIPSPPQPSAPSFTQAIAPFVPPPPALAAPGILPATPSVAVPVTGPVLRNNQAPTPPSQPTVSVGGRPTPLQTQIPNSNSMNLSAGAFNLGLSLQQNQGTVRQGAGGATEVEVPGGGRTTLQGSGLLPGSTVQVFLPFNGSNSREIARIPVSQTGTFSGDAIFGATPTERPLPIGRHVMQVVTVDENRQQVVVEMTINIAQPAPTPEVDRTQGVAPTLRAGQSIATNGGEPELVTVTPNSGEKSATVQGEGWSMAVQVGGDAGGVEPGAEGGAAVTFVRDQGATVSGNGFMPGTRADVWLFSDPTLLGSVQIDDTGAFNGEVLIDGNVITAGEHTLQLQGVGEDGFVRAANLGVSVEDAAGAVTTEEAAGFLWLLWAMVGLGVVAVGAGGTWWYRRATR